MASIFTRIISGEIPSYKIAENEQFVAFLDAFPIAEGHTLVIPKIEIDRLWDHSDETLSGLLPFAKTVALAIEKTIACQRVGVSVVGLEVPHAHIHLIPIDSLRDLDLGKPKLSFSKEQFKATLAAIQANL